MNRHGRILGRGTGKGHASLASSLRHNVDVAFPTPRSSSVDVPVMTGGGSSTVESAPRPSRALVVGIVVARGAAPELEAVLSGLASQDHPRLEVVVVAIAEEGSSSVNSEYSVGQVSERVELILPGSTVVAVPAGSGYGAAVAAALESRATSPLPRFLLFVPEDVVLGDTAVRRLVERAMEINAAVVGPKVIGPHGSLLETGWRLDRFCSPVPVVPEPEPDQGQHDFDLAPLAASGAAWMARADLFVELGGLDPEVAGPDSSVEFCLRARRAGASVAVVPSAVARRDLITVLDPAHRSRLRLRLLLTGHGRAALLLMPPLVLASLLGVAYGLVTGRFRHAWGLVAAWPWNMRRIASARRLRHRSSEAAPLGPVEPVAVSHHAFRRVVVGRDLAAERESSEKVGRLNGLFATAFGPGGLVLLGVLVVLAFGSRSLLKDGLPLVGRLQSLPSDPFELLVSWWLGWRQGGSGTDVLGPDGLALIGLFSRFFPWSTDTLWTTLVLGSLAVGAVGIWRLAQPVGGGRSRSVAVLVYLAVPLPYEALREGRVSLLAAFALLPWLARRLASAQAVAPYGWRGGEPGPGTRLRGFWSDVVVTGVVLAGLVVVEPLLVVPGAALLLGLVAGSLLIGSVDGLARLIAVAFGAILLAAAVHLTLVVDLIGNRAVTSLGSVLYSGTGRIDIWDVLGLGLEEEGLSASASLFLLPLIALLVSSDRHLGVAVRAWFVVATGSVLLVAVDRGWLEGPGGALMVVDPNVLFVVVAIGLAWASAAGAAALGDALRKLSMPSSMDTLPRLLLSTRLVRSIIGAIAAGALLVGASPVFVKSFDGAWGASRTYLLDALPDIGSRLADGEQRFGGDARILWIGDAEILPASGIPISERISPVLAGGSRPAVALTDGRPDLADQWSPGPTAGLAEIRLAVSRALSGDSHRLGDEVGRWGVARIILVERSAPVPEPAIERPLLLSVVAAFDRQLDLERVEGVNGAVTVYRNTAVEAPFSVVRDGNRRVVPATVRRDSLGVRTIGIGADGALRWMHGPDDRWEPSVEGQKTVILETGAVGGVEYRPSVRVAAGSEVVFAFDDEGRRRGVRFQLGAVMTLLLLVSWARTARRRGFPRSLR